MSYLVLARKYRPRVFADMIGQEAVAGVLQGAIREDRVGHAYLFTGPRGTGKTTTARILAKALNCEQGPTPTPCGTCARCQACDSGSEIDVIELDAASNNGVEDVRALRDQVAYAPADARYKIYIVDEVHMMSKAAFNALLKTLEEPPAHVKFFFATTELHKVPDTILSRCQVLRLSPIKREHIAKRLVQVFESEGIIAEPGVVEDIAERAHGGMRDALSLADQLIALGGTSPTLADLERTCGAGPRAARALLENVVAGERAPALEAVARASGREGELVDALLAVLHQACVAHWCGATSPLVEADGAELAAFAATLGPARLEYLARRTAAREGSARPAPGLEGVVLESTLLNCAVDEPADFAELLERLAALGLSRASVATPCRRAARTCSVRHRAPRRLRDRRPTESARVEAPSAGATPSGASRGAAVRGCARVEPTRSTRRSPPPAATADRPAPSAVDAKDAFAAALDDLARQRPALAELLRRGRVSRDGAELVVTLESYGESDRALCDDRRNRAMLDAAVRGVPRESSRSRRGDPRHRQPPPPGGRLHLPRRGPLRRPRRGIPLNAHRPRSDPAKIDGGARTDEGRHQTTERIQRMAGAFGEMGNLLKQAQEMQRQLDRLRDELDAKEVEGTAGGGAVRIRLSGYTKRVLGVHVAEEAFASGDRSLLEGLTQGALTDAITKAEKLAAETLGRATGGIQFPGLI
ncbi:MAG: DNA polymerase III subunit gamma/tau [Planctomycetota bacterium]